MRKKVYRTRLAGFIAAAGFSLAFFSVACGGAEDPRQIETDIAGTIAAIDTAAAPSATPFVTVPAEIMEPPTEFFPNTEAFVFTESPFPSQTPKGVPCYRARLLAESPGAYTQFAPGESFGKSWTLLNTGTCKWPAEVQWVYVSGFLNRTADIIDQMSGPDSQPIGSEVLVGQTITIVVSLRAPSAPGQYAGYWMLRNTHGGRFGQGLQGEAAFSVTIIVRSGMGTPTEEATSDAPTATLEPPTTEPPTATLPDPTETTG